MLALEVELLTGRYVATAFDDRASAEWPPHPSRLYSALVAAHYEAAEPNDAERAVLERISSFGPPEITASSASEREVVTVFVPVNDTSIVSSIDDEAGALATARLDLASTESKGGRAHATAEKKAAKAQQRLKDAASKVIAAVASGKEGKDGPRRAAAVLPDHRERQPRTFPSVTPDDPRVVFAWSGAELSADERAVIDALAARVVRLGHSSSLVSVRLCERVESPTWIPDDTGEIFGRENERMLRVVQPGQLAALDEAFAQTAYVPGRVMPAAFQRYVRPTSAAAARVPMPVFGQDWIVLRRVGGPRLPSTSAVALARAVRGALLRSHGENAPEILCGHKSSGEPSERPHLAIVPLPFVAHERADGSILGVALIVPRDATAEERRTILRAVEKWRRTGDAGGMRIHLGRAGSLVLEALDEEPAQSTLVARTWCARAARWSSATALALDRNPGDLRSADPAKEAAAYAEAEAVIARACTHIGLPSPRRVDAMPAAPLSGGDKARQFPPYETGKPPIQRVHIHARLEFDTPVDGPILLGAGRYLGLGLFRPVNHD